ncbi:putative Zn finger-like uncharacterized protein [Pseudomonas alcaligenes]|nr:putative Zn finger-like uncharacterized protein [Pseudomonas alcaligenes]
MKELEACPACSALFTARKALVTSGVGVNQNAFAARMQVRCPECRHVFTARTLRLFGFLPSNGLRWVVLGLVVACVVLAKVLPH